MKKLSENLNLRLVHTYEVNVEQSKAHQYYSDISSSKIARSYNHCVTLKNLFFVGKMKKLQKHTVFHEIFSH